VSPPRRRPGYALPDEVGIAVGTGAGLCSPVGALVGVGDDVAMPVADGTGVALPPPADADVVGTGVGDDVAMPVGDGTGVAELVADGELETAAPEPVRLADWLDGAEWLAGLVCWLVAAAAEHPAKASPPTAPRTKPAMTRDRLSSDCTCVLHDVASLLTLSAGKYVRAQEKLRLRGSNLCAAPDV
jgi:hypothetical protein